MTTVQEHIAAIREALIEDISHRDGYNCSHLHAAIDTHLDAIASCLNQSKSTPLEWMPIETAPKDVIDRMVKRGLSSKISSEHTWPDYMAELYAIAHGKQND